MSFKLPKRWGTLLIMAFLTAAVAISTLPQQALAQDEPEPTIEVESSNPMSGDADSIHAGGKLFMKWCAACHGIRADGNSRFGAKPLTLTPKSPYASKRTSIVPQ